VSPAPQPAPVWSRVATSADLEAIAETMARAFYADPVWAWAFPDADRRLEQHRAVWGFALESALGYGWVRMTDAASAAALWIPPGKPELRPEELPGFESMLAGLLGEGAARVLDTFDRFDRAHPADDGPHYYLSLLATHPDRRGQGLGMGLLAESLERIDAEGAAAYLESTNPDNHRRYEGLGFARWGEFELADDGPPVTQMWRNPSQLAGSQTRSP
jgi:GNAT superfamily N-acetyltransferase